MSWQTPPCTSNFYPRPPRGGRPPRQAHPRLDPKFLPTPSARRATLDKVDVVLDGRGFLPTPSARRATLRWVLRLHHRAVDISTHALREEGDPVMLLRGTRFCGYFYPRPPRGGRPGLRISARCIDRHFYPRPPRGGRRVSALRICNIIYFYPRPPRGGRPGSTAKRGGKPYFYPRPPRGGRPWPDRRYYLWHLFLPTPSARRAT